MDSSHGGLTSSLRGSLARSQASRSVPKSGPPHLGRWSFTGNALCDVPTLGRMDILARIGVVYWVLRGNRVGCDTRFPSTARPSQLRDAPKARVTLPRPRMHGQPGASH